jgi:hypothetical protein
MERMSYYKKQRKHSRSIFLNTDEAEYVDGERKTFRFSINPINIEDESKIYVKNTIIDYRTAGLSVGKINQGFFSATPYLSTYSIPPNIIFTPQDGKGTGASAIGILAPSGLSGSSSSTTTTVDILVVGAGYTGATSLYVANAIPPLTGGSGATITPTTISAITGGISGGTLVAGSGYTDVPLFNIPPPPATVLATFDTVPHTASTGTITGVPNVLNPTLNGFYHSSLFTIGFQNNPIRATGFCQTNASGTITSITLENSADNGFYSSASPISILAVNGVLTGSGGTGLTITPTYSNGRCASIVVNSGGSGYGANLVDAPVLFSLPATPVAGAITNKTISLGRLTAITFGSGGSGYYKPSIFIDPISIVPPVQASYAPVYKIASLVNGFRLLSYGRGYTKPPILTIDTTNRVLSSGDFPAVAELTPTHLVEPNDVYTIKADGFVFNRSLYTNTDNKALPTIAICSPNEIVNNEEYSELILPSQVINDITLTIADRDGTGLEANHNLIILLEIEELDLKDTVFQESKRQQYTS